MFSYIPDNFQLNPFTRAKQEELLPAQPHTEVHTHRRAQVNQITHQRCISPNALTASTIDRQLADGGGSIKQGREDFSERIPAKTCRIFGRTKPEGVRKNRRTIEQTTSFAITGREDIFLHGDIISPSHLRAIWRIVLEDVRLFLKTVVRFEQWQLYE